MIRRLDFQSGQYAEPWGLSPSFPVGILIPNSGRSTDHFRLQEWQSGDFRLWRSGFLAADFIHTCSSAVRSFCIAQSDKYKFWHGDYPLGSKVRQFLQCFRPSDCLFLPQNWSTVPYGSQGLAELMLLYMIKFVHLCLLA